MAGKAARVAERWTLRWGVWVFESFVKRKSLKGFLGVIEETLKNLLNYLISPNLSFFFQEFQVILAPNSFLVSSYLTAHCHINL